jgi:gas vesicle protein
MSSVNHGNGFGSFLGTFVVGAAAGATIAFLTAPRSGRETGARLKQAVREMGETMQQFTDLPDAVQKYGAKAVKVGQAVFAQAEEQTTQAYNKATEARPGSKEYVGYTLDKGLPRFAK